MAVVQQQYREDLVGHARKPQIEIVAGVIRAGERKRRLVGR